MTTDQDRSEEKYAPTSEVVTAGSTDVEVGWDLLRGAHAQYREARQGMFAYWQHVCGNVESMGLLPGGADQDPNVEGGCDACESSAGEWRRLYVRDEPASTGAIEDPHSVAALAVEVERLRTELAVVRDTNVLMNDTLSRTKLERDEARAQADVLQHTDDAALTYALLLLDRLADNDPCRLDDDYCWRHGRDLPCAIAEARKLLATYDTKETEQ